MTINMTIDMDNGSVYFKFGKGCYTFMIQYVLTVYFKKHIHDMIRDVIRDMLRYMLHDVIRYVI